MRVTRRLSEMEFDERETKSLKTVLEKYEERENEKNHDN